MLALVGAGVYFDAPAILGDLSTLVALSSVLCVALVGAAPFLERMARRRAGRPSRYARRAARADRPVSVLGAPPRTPARALLQMHASMGLIVTSGVSLAVTGLGALTFFLSADPRTLPFLLPMAATLGTALIPTLPLATGQAGALRFDFSPAMWLPVRPSTLWWTSLVAVCAQLGIALTMASVGTAALGLALPSVSAADTVTRILAGSPLCAAAVLLLRAGLHLGPLLPEWARVSCLCVGAFAGLAAPVEIGLPRDLLREQRLAFSVTFLLTTMAALVALTPRRVRGA